MPDPIIGNGKLIGTINFARVGITPAFNTRDMSNLSAVCSHFSTCLANLRSAAVEPNPYLKQLTEYEQEEDLIQLGSVDLKLELSEIYTGVNFENA